MKINRLDTTRVSVRRRLLDLSYCQSALETFAAQQPKISIRFPFLNNVTINHLNLVRVQARRRTIQILRV